MSSLASLLRAVPPCLPRFPQVRMQAFVKADEAAIMQHTRRPAPAGIWQVAAHMYR